MLHCKSKSVQFLVSKRTKRQDNIRNNTNDVQEKKENELSLDLAYLKNESQEKNQKIHDLELSLDYNQQKIEGYTSQITLLKQRNECLRDAFNESNSRYNDTNQLLLNANQEIINLKKELSLQILYEQDIQSTQKDNDTLVLHQTWNDRQLNKTLTKQMEEKYLNQLNDMNQKYRESTTKYTDIHNINIALQNELSSSKSLISDLEGRVRDLEYELEHQTADLKQSLNEMSESRELFDSDGNEVEITYIPRLKTRKSLRMRSKTLSQGSIISDGSRSPFFSKSMSGDWDDFLSCTDLFVDGLHNTIMEDDDNDLFQQISDYLFQMEEYVEKMKRLQLLHRRRDNNTEKDEKRYEEDDIVCEMESETLLKILNTDQEEQILVQIGDIVERCKECITEIYKQQMVMRMNEKNKYEDLDKVFSRHQMNTIRKLKRLTKDIYEVEYKKYDGYKHIWWEMIGNVSMYTKDAILYKLTH